MPVVDPDVIKIPDGFRVLYLVESADALKKEEYNVINSLAIRAYLNDKCAKNGSHPEWRKYDPQTIFAATESPTMKQLYDALTADLVKTPRKLPLVLICEHGNGHLRQLPTDPTEALALIKSFGDK